MPADFAQEVDEIAARWKRPADRMTEATRLVQDRIRYVGVEIGEGSFVPRRPADVVAVVQAGDRRVLGDDGDRPEAGVDRDVPGAHLRFPSSN